MLAFRDVLPLEEGGTSAAGRRKVAASDRRVRLTRARAPALAVERE